MTDDAPKPRTIAQLPWIKARVGLERDPVVLHMAENIKRHRKYVVGCWLALWSWADGITEDGRLPGMTLAGIDSVVEHKGFSAAAADFPEHPWIEVHPWGLMLPRYDRHNGVNAKGRALDSERKRKARLAEGNPESVRNLSGSDQDTSGTRGEERREDKKRAKEAPSRAAPEAVKEPAPSRQFTDGWIALFAKHRDGAVYAFEGAKDGGHVKAIMGFAKGDVAEALRRAGVHLEDPFYAEKGASLSTFRGAWNRCVHGTANGSSNGTSNGHKPARSTVAMQQYLDATRGPQPPARPTVIEPERLS